MITKERLAELRELALGNGYLEISTNEGIALLNLVAQLEEARELLAGVYSVINQHNAEVCVACPYNFTLSRIKISSFLDKLGAPALEEKAIPPSATVPPGSIPGPGAPSLDADQGAEVLSAEQAFDAMLAPGPSSKLYLSHEALRAKLEAAEREATRWRTDYGCTIEISDNDRAEIKKLKAELAEARKERDEFEHVVRLYWAWYVAGEPGITATMVHSAAELVVRRMTPFNGFLPQTFDQRLEAVRKKRDTLAAKVAELEVERDTAKKAFLESDNECFELEKLNNALLDWAREAYRYLTEDLPTFRMAQTVADRAPDSVKTAPETCQPKSEEG